ncbi:MAG: DsbA family protein [Pseudomonadales bacterium]
MSQSASGPGAVATVVVVTDPMCSWCWGMAAAVEQAAAQLAHRVRFDILLGGINTHGTQPVGDYGRRYLMHVWREVQATTGQPFAFTVPDGLIYNSTLPCLAVAAVRRAIGRPPFGYLHRLQQLLFAQGVNVNDAALLAGTAAEFGVASDEVRAAFRDPGLAQALRAEFAGARRYGTHALPSLLIERDGERRLLAGGYADAATVAAMVRARLGDPDPDRERSG